MKTHTQTFKNNICLFGRELDSKITYTQNGTQVELGVEDLNSITPHYEGGILKSVMKQLDIDSNAEIPLGTILTYQFGVKVGNTYEYINFGNYIVYNVEKQEDTRSYKITCYDKMLYAMKDYESLEVTYPITVRNYINALCTKIGLTFKNASGTFANYDKQIPNELYLDEDGKSLGYTFRDVLDELAEVTASTICINEADNQLEIRYITNTNDTIDEEFLKDVNVNFGEKFGAVNTIVLSRSAGADNIYYPATLPQNPIEIKISDNQIMNGNDRDTYMPDIYNKLNGLEYYINDFSSTGICYYNLCDRYNVSIDGTTYSCVMFNDEVNVTQGLEEMVYTEMPEEAETDYKKSDTTDRRINQTTLIVDKQQHEIEALVDTTEDIEKEINPTQDVNGTTFHLEDSTDAELVNFEMEGKTTQETRSGKNLFNFSGKTSYDITSIYDNGIVLNGTTSSTWFDISNNSSVNSSNTTYTISVNKTLPFRLSFVYTNGNNTTVYKFINKGSTSLTFTDSYGIYSGHLTADQLDTTSFSNYTFTFQLETGSTATSYEPYGQMPSPDYPSELVSVGYANLFNKETPNVLNAYLSAGKVITSSANDRTIYIPCKPNTTYTVSKMVQQTTANNRFALGYSNNLPTLGGSITERVNLANGTTETKLSITTDSNAKYLLAYIYFQDTSTTFDEMLNSIQITKGTQEHSYIPYGKYGIEIKTRGNNLLKGMSTPKTDEYWIDASSQYFTPLENGWGKFEVNNTSGSSTAFINAKVRVGQIDLKPNTLYTIVAEIRNGNISANSGCFFQLCTANPTASWQTAKSIGYANINAGGTYLLTSTTKSSFEGMASYFDSYLRIAAGYSGSLEIRVSLIEGSYSLDKFNYEPYKKKTYLYTLNQPLRSIGDTKDLLYIQNNMLYVERKIGSRILNGSEGWGTIGDNRYWVAFPDKRGLTSAVPCMLKSNYFKATDLAGGTVPIGYITEGYYTIADYNVFFNYNGVNTDLAGFKTWLSTHNTEVQYLLASSNTEGLGKIEVPSTYKTITHIDTIDINEPNMNITYVRDTQISNYVEEHISQIIVNEEGILSRVQTIEDSDYDSKINSLETKQTSTDLTIDIISTNIDRTTGDVNAVTTREKNFTFNDSGLNIASSDNTFSSKIDEQGLVFKNGDTTVAEYTKDGSKQKDLSLFGVYYYGMNSKDDTPMFVAQLYTDKNGEETFGHFYNKGD